MLYLNYVIEIIIDINIFQDKGIPVSHTMVS